ncbi:MAG: MarC family protein [Alphaproteobacteria bacterium]|nr:MAG: MarC family protein [Alphaproteobacteria bacterium]
MLDAFITAFVTFFVVIDPLGIAPVFASLTHGADETYRRRMAWRGTAIAVLVLLFFAFLGAPFLKALGIGLEAFKVAGGVMLFLMALEMVFEKRTERRSSSAERSHREPPEDISVFPLGIPLLAGPGAIASTILLMASHAGDPAGKAVVIAAMLLTLGLTLITFYIVGPMVRLLGTTFSTILSRVFGIVLAALAAQFILDGVRSFFAG